MSVWSATEKAILRKAAQAATKREPETEPVAKLSPNHYAVYRQLIDKLRLAGRVGIIGPLSLFPYPDVPNCAKDGPTEWEIGKELGISESSVCEAVCRLEEKGLLYAEQIFPGSGNYYCLRKHRLANYIKKQRETLAAKRAAERVPFWQRPEQIQLRAERRKEAPGYLRCIIEHGERLTQWEKDFVKEVQAIDPSEWTGRHVYKLWEICYDRCKKYRKEMEL